MKTSVKLLTLVVLFVCVHSAAGLQCRSCGGSSCSSQTSQICSSGQSQCVSRTYAGSYDYGDYSYTYNYTYKGCASASDCTAAGSEFVSYNYGPNTYAVNTTCCDTDNCNNQNQPIVVPPVGSLQCYSCDPYSYECTANVTCNTQEVCGQAVVDQYNPSRPFYGCVSENLCNNTSLSQRYLNFSSPVSCCSTSHCNVPDLGLQCLSCTDSSCSSQRSVTCSKLAPFCYTDAYAGSYDYGSYNYSWIDKGCASSSICTAAGSEFVSYDTGSRSYLRNYTCCNTDDCNAPNLTIPAPPAGSLQCYGCDPNTNECRATVTCSVLETCANTSVGSYSVYGCVSENLCNNLTFSQRYLYTNNQPLSCCNTSYCNAPWTTTTEAPPTTTYTTPTTTEARPTTTYTTPTPPQRLRPPQSRRRRTRMSLCSQEQCRFCLQLCSCLCCCSVFTCVT
ncbi:urokinase plasminogen activator surface receptor-like [Boleophthalmus pectinirostris]|uniref:urokinase plasminogen activator surface receptor-like n=1 Tax=Boleophthalmus pectinirostris TaxID=150288 RepID=UPI002431444D|nr:urokinase plasminogen activator surface receptor-like [Boleophthalmus pectinirostris]